MLYLHILQAGSTENWNAFCKLIVLNNHKISKKSKTSVLRYIENITGSVGNFVKCICHNLFGRKFPVCTICYEFCMDIFAPGFKEYRSQKLVKLLNAVLYNNLELCDKLAVKSFRVLS